MDLLRVAAMNLTAFLTNDRFRLVGLCSGLDNADLTKEMSNQVQISRETKESTMDLKQKCSAYGYFCSFSFLYDKSAEVGNGVLTPFTWLRLRSVSILLMSFAWSTRMPSIVRRRFHPMKYVSEQISFTLKDVASHCLKSSISCCPFNANAILTTTTINTKILFCRAK